MDAMALLCNMHADGPATIKVLRRAGISSLAELTRTRPDRLADVLGVSPAYARRFTREARLLGERMGEEVLDPEECVDLELSELDVAARRAGAELGVPGRSRAREASPSAGLFARSQHRAVASEAVASEPDEDARTAAEAEPEAYAGIVWFARSSPPLPFDAPRTRFLSGEEREVDEPTSGEDRARVLAPPDAPPDAHRARVLAPAGSALRPGWIEGLDAAWCDRLVAQGVLTLETLAEAPGMKLARRLGVPLTELMNLQLLAQRKLGELRATDSASAVERATHTAVAQAEAEPEYVLYPPRRTSAELGEDSEPREGLDLSDGEPDALAAVDLHSSVRDAAEDVGGPFA